MNPFWWRRYNAAALARHTISILVDLFFVNFTLYFHVQVYSNKIIRYLEDPSDSLSLIRDEDQLVAYRLPKDFGKFPLVVFMHQQIEE